MSRTLGAGLLAHVAGPVLTLAVCVRVERTDSTVYGFTSHNRNLTFDSQEYLATSAVAATQARNTLGHQLDNIEVIGLVQSDVVEDEDLLGGLYDGAQVEVFAVNWRDNPILERAILHTGTIGEVTWQDGRWVAEFRPLSARLTHQIGDLTAPTCRVKQLGDAQCAPGGEFADGATLADYQRASVQVATVTDRYNLSFDAVADATGFFDYGKVTFSSGNNAGQAREVKTHTLVSGDAVIVLQEPFARTVLVGDVATLEAGCNRTWEQCLDRFQNRLNYRGEPAIPTTDVALQRGRKG